MKLLHVLGMIGMICVIIFYLLFMFAAIRITVNAGTRQGMFLGTALTTLLTFQAFINIGVVSGGLPTKGISAPFISYGGSNLLMNMVMAALLISVGLENVPGLTDNWWGRKK